MSPWQIVLVALAGWLNREQSKVIDYLNAHYRPTTLYNTLTIFVLIAGGIGFILRALREHKDSEESE